MPISKDTMKNVFKCVLDMRNDTAIICGKKIKLEDNNKAGHYMLDFLPGHIETYEDALTAMFEDSYAMLRRWSRAWKQKSRHCLRKR
jgi:hypothetical protein